MNKSESIAELATALAVAQGQITGALKDSSNPFFKSKYADLASVVEAIRIPVSENGLSYVQLTIPSEKEEVMVETVILHSSGQWISSVLALPVSKVDAQGFGSALTYARRYGLSAAFGVAPEDDDGNAASKAAPDPARRLANANITPNAGAVENVSPEVKKAVDKVASSVIDAFEVDDVDAAVNICEEADLSMEGKLYLWTLLDSKQRSAIKRVQGERRKAKLVQLEGSQA